MGGLWKKGVAQTRLWFINLGPVHYKFWPQSLSIPTESHSIFFFLGGGVLKQKLLIEKFGHAMLRLLNFGNVQSQIWS